MILDNLPSSRTYLGLHPCFARAFAFLRTLPAALPEGRVDLDGDRLYAVVVKTPGRGKNAAVLETHLKYIDIQFQVSGTDCIGWSPASGLTPKDSYDPDKDLRFYTDRPVAWLDTPPGFFAVFYPDDAHAPLGGSGDILKVVVKVRCT